MAASLDLEAGCELSHIVEEGQRDQSSALCVAQHLSGGSVQAGALYGLIDQNGKDRSHIGTVVDEVMPSARGMKLTPSRRTIWTVHKHGLNFEIK